MVNSPVANPNIRAMEIHLRNAVRSALAAQNRLRKARRAAGLWHQPEIYTADAVKEMRLEWFEQFRGLMHANISGKYRRQAELAIAVVRNASADTSAKKMANKIVAAGETARAGGPGRPRPTGKAADILAAGEKRRGLSE